MLPEYKLIDPLIDYDDKGMENWWILIQGGDYKDVIFKFTSISIEEDKENDCVFVHSNYTIMDDNEYENIDKIVFDRIVSNICKDLVDKMFKDGSYGD